MLVEYWARKTFARFGIIFQVRLYPYRGKLLPHIVYVLYVARSFVKTAAVT